MKNFPYILGNTKTSIFPHDSSTEKTIRVGTGILHDPKFGLIEGITFAYKSLLQCIADGDKEMIENFCEGNLSSKINESIDEFQENGLKLDIINKNRYSFNIQVAEMRQIMGAHINRRKNIGHTETNFGGMLGKENSKFYKIYVPQDIRNALIPMNLDFVFKISTNLKLNVIDSSGKYLINYDDFEDEEVHFVRFESLFTEMEFNIQSLLNIRKKMMNGNIEFSNWTITDFDRCLFDNPHIR